MFPDGVDISQPRNLRHSRSIRGDEVDTSYPLTLVIQKSKCTGRASHQAPAERAIKRRWSKPSSTGRASHHTRVERTIDYSQSEPSSTGRAIHTPLPPPRPHTYITPPELYSSTPTHLKRASRALELSSSIPPHLHARRAPPKLPISIPLHLYV